MCNCDSLREWKLETAGDVATTAEVSEETLAWAWSSLAPVCSHLMLRGRHQGVMHAKQAFQLHFRPPSFPSTFTSCLPQDSLPLVSCWNVVLKTVAVLFSSLLFCLSSPSMPVGWGIHGGIFFIRVSTWISDSCSSSIFLKLKKFFYWIPNSFMVI